MEYQELNQLIKKYHILLGYIRELDKQQDDMKIQISGALKDANIQKYQVDNLLATLTTSVRRSINIKEAEVLLDKDTFEKLAKATPVTTLRVTDITKEEVK
jgi:hypothetical protein